MAASFEEDLTAREGEILTAIGRRLTNAEIAAEFFLSVRTVESHIAALRRKLVVDSRAGLIEAASSRRAASVPLPQNAFVGRAADLAAVRDLLGQQRWVTIVGPGGGGKTRLALELAAGDPSPVVVELEHASDADVVQVVARALGLAGSDADLVAACGLALGARPSLLVLDNSDRVAETVARLVGDLLRSARSLRVLATSRAPTGASDEAVYTLAPLAVDAEDGGAVRLFAERARAASPGVALDGDDAMLVARICSRLDGLPLAIELAAARVRHLSVAELADLLDAGFDALDRSGPSHRHRTLEATFEWTWDLLDNDEKRVLGRLAALPRTFDLTLAEAVTEVGAAQVVLRLLDRSLVAQAPTAQWSGRHPRRFRLLSVVRAFALDRTDAAVVGDVRRRHADHIAEVARAMARRARTDDSREAADATRQLRAEATAALDWSVDAKDPGALDLARSLALLVEQYGVDVASLDAIARAAGDADVRAAATPDALLDIGLTLEYGDLDLVTELSAQALAAAADDRGRLAAHHLAGYTAAYRHDPQTAMGHFDVAASLADERIDLWQLASVYQGRGVALRARGQLHESMAAFDASMRAYGLAGDAMHVNNARYMMASVAAEAGERTDEALGWVEECAVYARASGNRHEYAHAVLTRASLRSAEHGEDDVRDAVEIFRGVGDLRCLARSYLLLAREGPEAERLGHLESALDVAARAHDDARRALALEQLVAARWAVGQRREAAVVLGELLDLVGDDAAARAPDELGADLEAWAAAIAEGRARSARR